MQERRYIGSFTLFTLLPSILYSISTSPAGASMRTIPGVLGWISPSSMAMVMVPIGTMAAWADSRWFSINKTATSLAGSCNGYGMLTLIISWPRGSNAPFLSSRILLKKCCLFPHITAIQCRASFLYKAYGIAAGMRIGAGKCFITIITFVMQLNQYGP